MHILHYDLLTLIHKAHSFINLVKLVTALQANTLSSHSAALMGGLLNKNVQVHPCMNQHHKINSLVVIHTHKALYYDYLY
jgi:hypothetical protein